MSVATEQLLDDGYDSEPNELEQYRPLSSRAVLALVFGAMSLAAAFDYWLVVVPIVGVFFGLLALRQLAAQSEEFSGAPLAITGLALSAVMLIAGPARVYMEETAPIPAGFREISYDELQPDANVLGQIVPDGVKMLDGKKIYIKGFVYSGISNKDIPKFVLVRDAGTCCFGGNPKLTDRIVVSLNKPLDIYTKNVARVAGTFRLNPQAITSGVGAYYYLDQAELR